jgi:hypothetical protein
MVGFASVFYDMSVESTERSRDEARIDGSNGQSYVTINQCA